jgi:hypothetical protein
VPKDATGTAEPLKPEPEEVPIDEPEEPPPEEKKPEEKGGFFSKKKEPKKVVEEEPEEDPFDPEAGGGKDEALTVMIDRFCRQVNIPYQKDM